MLHFSWADILFSWSVLDFSWVDILFRKKKKAGKVKSKLREKMKLNMIRPGDRIEQQDDENLFDLNRMKTKVL